MCRLYLYREVFLRRHVIIEDVNREIQMWEYQTYFFCLITTTSDSICIACHIISFSGSSSKHIAKSPQSQNFHNDLEIMVLLVQSIIMQPV